MPQPNLLIVIADQLAAHALAAFGHPFAATPNIDRLAAEGVRFAQAFTPCPLCRPARASFWTGRLPHQTGVLSNGNGFDDPPVAENVPTLGGQMAAAGYRCVHFGKTHDHGALRGFEIVPQERDVADSAPIGYGINADTWIDAATERQAATWLGEHRGEQPWCCVADLNNPHNICGFVAGNDEGCIDGPLPPLPENFADEDLASRPIPVRHVCCAHRRQMQGTHWNERQWRQYRAAYRYYIEDFDARLGRLLDALAQRDDADDTTILFWADHGDGMGAHRLITKHTTFYEETVRVPLIAAGAGVTARGCASGDPLVSLVDLVPTICELAGAAIPPDLPGRSLVPCLCGATAEDRPYVVSQWHTEWGTTIEPGRMLRTREWKYTVYREGGGEELYDLVQDPGERQNRAADPAYAADLARMRNCFAAYCRDQGDPFPTLDWKADPRWRAHPPGYHHHHDSCAPIVAGVCR